MSESQDITPELAASRKARIEEFRERFLVIVRRQPGMEQVKDMQFHPDALIDMFGLDVLDLPEDEWQAFLAAFDLGELSQVGEDDDSPEEIAEAQRRSRDLAMGKRDAL